MRPRHVVGLATLAAAAAFVACTLNPQPLPPGDGDNEAAFGDAGTRSDSGGFGIDPNAPPPADAGGASLDTDGGDGGPDAAGLDGGDGGLDADADGG